MIKLFLGDGEDIHRLGLAELLNKEPGIKVAAEASSLKEKVKLHD